MMRIMKNSGKRAGFTLIELAIVLAITALLTAGLWRMMSSGNTQMRDQAAADQHRDLIKAVQGYLASTNGVSVLSKAGANATFNLALNGAVDGTVAGATAAEFGAFVNFLPPSIVVGTTNSYNQTYQIRVRKDANAAGTPPLVYSFMIKTTGGDQIPDTSGGRISSMIGADGGFVYNAVVCGGANTFACGAYGSWVVNPTVAAPAGFGFGASAVGHVASQTTVGTNAAFNTPWLARLNVPGDALFAAGGLDDYNTVQTPLSLGGQILYGATTIAGIGGRIQNLARMYMEKTNAVGQASLEMLGCSPTGPGDPLCTDTVTITGGVGITGHLKASNLYAGSFIYDTSDQRKKHDIVKLTDVLQKFEQLNGYSFVMNGGTEKKYGVIAQEVEKVFPEIVQDGSDGFKTVDYMGLVGPLVEAVRELKAENEALRKDVNTLKSAAHHKK